MKKTLIYITFSLLVIGCKDLRLEGIYDDSVLFLKYGTLEVNGFISDDGIEVELPIYRSGIGEETIDVYVQTNGETLREYNKVNNTHYENLPSDCYKLTLEKVSFDKNSRNKTVKILIDIEKLKNLPGMLEAKYVIPLQLLSSNFELDKERSNLLIIPSLTGGIRKGSETVLWSKTFEELGIDNTDHLTASFAVTSQYIYVNTRNEDLKFYDRLSGVNKGTIQLPFKGNLNNFTITSDDKDNLLVTNLRNSTTGKARQTIYIISDSNVPEVFIDSEHEYPNGRKLSVRGDLRQDAIITSTVENSSQIIYWVIKDGKPISHKPEILSLDANVATWRFFADAMPLGLNMDEGVFVVGYGPLPVFGLFDKEGKLKYAINLEEMGFPSSQNNIAQSLASIHFNGADYLAVANQQGADRASAVIIDITKLEYLNQKSSNELIVYRSADMQTLSNLNTTADVHMKVSEDKSKLILYLLGTNGGISAIEFSS